MLLRKWQIFPGGKLWYLNYGNAILCNRVHIPVETDHELNPLPIRAARANAIDKRNDIDIFPLIADDFRHFF